eukprot:6456542-Amphidinium_carterae.1
MESQVQAWLQRGTDNKFFPRPLGPLLDKYITFFDKQLQSYGEAQQHYANVEGYMGLSVKAGQTWGAIFRKECADRAAVSLGKAPGQTFRASGLPLDMPAEELATMLTETKWREVQVIEGSRRLFRGTATWLLKSVHSPPVTSLRMSHSETHQIFAVSIEPNRSKTEPKQDRPPPWMNWAQRLKQPMAPPPASQWKNLSTNSELGASSKSPRSRAWRKDLSPTRREPGSDGIAEDQMELELLQEESRQWSFEVESVGDPRASSMSEHKGEPEGKRQKQAPSRMEKMETQLADLSSKLEQMMYGLQMIHNKVEQQAPVGAVPSASPPPPRAEEVCVSVPCLSGGAKRGQKSSLAAVQGFAPDQLLTLHEDEYPHSSELPVLAHCEGSASITTVNVTSLRQQWEAVVTLNSDVICITEVRLDSEQQRAMADRMDRKGYTVVWGAPPPLRVSKRNREYLAWGGVAIAVKNHWSITEIRPLDDPDLMRLYQQGRFVSAEIVSPGASQRLQVHTLYATADPHQTQEHKWQVETALSCVVANGWFQRHSVLAGDFNRECQEAPLFELLEDATLTCPFDLLDIVRPDGLPGERKIDHIFCSPPMADLVLDATIIPFAPFPGHTPVTCSFRVTPPEVQPRLALPQPLPVQHLPDYPKSSADL